MNTKIQLRHAGLAALVVGVAAAGCSSAGTEIPEVTQTTAEAIYVTPLPSLSFPTFKDLEGMVRPVVAVGRDFVYVTNTGGLLAYKRNVDANGSIDGTALPTTPSSNLSYQNLFQSRGHRRDHRAGDPATEHLVHRGDLLHQRRLAHDPGHLDAVQ